jgi:hypothetical protein
MSIQSNDLHNREAESSTFHAPRPVEQTCDTGTYARVLDADAEAYAWHGVQDAFRAWLIAKQPSNPTTLAAMLTSIRRYSNGGEL